MLYKILGSLVIFGVCTDAFARQEYRIVTTIESIVPMGGWSFQDVRQHKH